MVGAAEKPIDHGLEIATLLRGFRNDARGDNRAALHLLAHDLNDVYRFAVSNPHAVQRVSL